MQFIPFFINGAVRAVIQARLKEQFYAWNDLILCYGTLYAIGKISVKNAKRFDKKWRLSLISRYF